MNLIPYVTIDLGRFFFNSTGVFVSISGEPLQANNKRIFVSDSKLNCLSPHRFCFLNFARKVPGIIG